MVKIQQNRNLYRLQSPSQRQESPKRIECIIHGSSWPEAPTPTRVITKNVEQPAQSRTAG